MPLTDLVTAIFNFEEGLWSLSWVEVDLPDEEGFTSLDAAIARAEAAVSALYAGTKERETAELQYAIYPWELDESDADADEDALMTLMEISGSPGDLVAVGDERPDIEVHAATADQLVAAAELQLAEPSLAAFHRVKKVALL